MKTKFRIPNSTLALSPSNVLPIILSLIKITNRKIKPVEIVLLILGLLVHCNHNTRSTGFSKKNDSGEYYITEQHDEKEFLCRYISLDGKRDNGILSGCKELPSLSVKKSTSFPESHLSWSDNQGEMNWHDAKKKCVSLGMNLPTVEELWAADKAGITKSWDRKHHVWSSKEYSEDMAAVHDEGLVYRAGKLNDFHVRCIRTVKETSKPASFVKDGDSEIYKKETAKIKSYPELSSSWSEYQGKMDWKNAKKKCEDIGMRVPTRDELEKAKLVGVTKSWEDNRMFLYASEEDFTLGRSSNLSFGFDFDFDPNIDLDNAHVRCIQL